MSLKAIKSKIRKSFTLFSMKPMPILSVNVNLKILAFIISMKNME
jgi:hypothetical protein